MTVFADIMDWFLILALLGLIGSLAAIVMGAVQLKNATVASYNKLTGRPIERSIILVRTGKGIAQQEAARAKHIAASAQRAAVAVKVTADEAKVAVDALKDADIGPLMEQAQAAIKFASAAASVLRAAAKQGSADTA